MIDRFLGSENREYFSKSKQKVPYFAKTKADIIF